MEERGLSARRIQRLRDFFEYSQRLASRGVCGQRRIAGGIEQMRMRLGGKAQRAGNRNVGVANSLAEPPRQSDARALLFEHFKHAADLGLATLAPDFRSRVILAQNA